MLVYTVYGILFIVYFSICQPLQKHRQSINLCHSKPIMIKESECGYSNRELTQLEENYTWQMRD